MLDRRHFLSATATGLAAATALGGTLLAQLAEAPAKLPDSALFDKNEDAYWAEMRTQFLIPKRRDLPEQWHRGLQSRARAARHFRRLYHH